MPRVKAKRPRVNFSVAMSPQLEVLVRRAAAVKRVSRNAYIRGVLEVAVRATLEIPEHSVHNQPEAL